MSTLPIPIPKPSQVLFHFERVADGEGEAGKGEPGGRRRRLREGEELEALDESAEILFGDRFVSSSSAAVSLGENYDARDADSDGDPSPRVGRDVGFRELDRLPHDRSNGERGRQ